MYLMYKSKSSFMSFNYYVNYVKKRWFRIAPAFYIAIIVYGFFQTVLTSENFNWPYAFKSALFIRNLFPEETAFAPHFWSLGTEWHFYLVLPLILIGIESFSFPKFAPILVLFCLLVRILLLQSFEDFYNIIDYSILNRLIEFLVGIIAAYFFLEKIKFYLFNSWFGLSVGVSIAFLGRFCMSRQMQDAPHLIGFLAKSFDLPLLTLGMGIIILNSLNKSSWLTKFLESKIMNRIGKYSYSMYLWHWLIAGSLSAFWINHFPSDPFVMTNIVFIISLVILYPLSSLSFALFESQYFKRQK